MRYPERERRAIVRLRRLRPELGEALDFLSAAAALAAEREQGPPIEPPQAPTPGLPPLAPGEFPLDERTAADDFRKLLKSFVEVTGSAEGGAVLAAVAEGRLDLRRLARAYLDSSLIPFERAASRLEGIEPGLLIHFAELAVKPQLIAAARRMRGADARGPSDRCPLCGSPPDLLMIADQKEAERSAMAICRLCESEWPVKRVRCLACGNEDADSLSYLQAEGEEDLRVNVCEACHRYVPVLDTRGRLEVAPMIERAAAAHLDIIAQRRGYLPLEAAWQTAGPPPEPDAQERGRNSGRSPRIFSSE